MCSVKVRTWYIQPAHRWHIRLVRIRGSCLFRVRSSWRQLVTEKSQRTVILCLLSIFIFYLSFQISAVALLWMFENIWIPPVLSHGWTQKGLARIQSSSEDLTGRRLHRMNCTFTRQKWCILMSSNHESFILFWFWQIRFYSLFEAWKINKNSFWTKSHKDFTNTIFSSSIASYDLSFGNEHTSFDIIWESQLIN